MNKNGSHLFYKMNHLWLTLLFMLILFSFISRKYRYLNKIPVHTENQIVQPMKLAGNKTLHQPDIPGTNREIIITSSDKKESAKIIAEQSCLYKIIPVQQYSLEEQKSYSSSKGKLEKKNKNEMPIPPGETINKPAFVAFVLAFVFALILSLNFLVAILFGNIYLTPQFFEIYRLLMFLAPVTLILGIISLVWLIKTKQEGKGYAIFSIIIGLLFTFLLAIILHISKFK